MSQFAGHESLVRNLVEAALRQPRSADQPIVVLHAPPGGGKTALLRHVHALGSARTACAYVRVGEVRTARAVLAEVAHGLHAKVSMVRRIEFPRLRLGLLACAAPLDGDDRGQALDELRGLLGDDRGRRRLNRAIRGLGDLLAGMAFPDPAAEAVRFALAKLAPVVVDRLALRRVLRWHAAHAVPACADGYDALVNLHRRFAAGDDEAVNAVLFRAFLADLHDAHHRELRHWDRAPALVLLDDADHPAGRSFLDLYSRARTRHVDAGFPCDPLMLIAAVRRRPAEATRSRRASLGEWQLHRVEGDPWRYPVILEGLRPEDIQELAGAFAGWIPRAGAFLHGLTRGHPGAIAVILRRPPSDPRDVLDELSTEALDVLLGRTEGELRAALVQLAPATDVDDARYLADQGRATETQIEELAELLDTVWWAPDGESGGFVRNALLRRVLLAELARTGRWEAVHRELAAPERPPPARLRHTFAVDGKITPVVEHFAARFPPEDAAAWWAELCDVVAAAVARPRRETGGAGAVFEALMADVHERGAPLQIAKLAAAQSIVADPLGDPRQELVLFQLPAALRALARDLPRGSAFLIQLARALEETQ